MRREPSLDAPAVPADGLSVAPRTATRRRRSRGRSRLLWALLLTPLILGPLPVLLLRWLPPPTTAFMLQSPTRPVQYDWVPRAQIAEVARKAVVAAEDQKFWQHRGFDLEAIEKAYRHNQRGRKVRGASTISQQTAKNLFLWSGGGYFRKGLEAGYTVLMEALWPKERILEVYLNIAEFGPGLYGVEAAARHYFRKPAARLTAAEAARLAAVLPSPRRWSVLNPGSYVQKRGRWILGQMGYGPRPSQPEPEPLPPPELLPELESAEPTEATVPAEGMAVPPPQEPEAAAPVADPSTPPPESAAPAPDARAPEPPPVAAEPAPSE